MSHQHFKEQEIITHRLSDGQETHAIATAKEENKQSHNKPRDSLPDNLKLITFDQPENKNYSVLEGKNFQSSEPTKPRVSVEKSQQHSNGSARGSVEKASLPVIAHQQQQEELDIFKVEEDDPSKRFPLIVKILENNVFQTYIFICTLYALFASDIRVLSTNVNADLGFDVVTIIVMFSFAVEFLLLHTRQRRLHIQLFSNAVFYGGGGSTGKSSAQLVKAGKASRLGARAGRIVRLVRLIRIVKLYKAVTDDTTSENSEAVAKILQTRKNKKVHPAKHENAQADEQNASVQNTKRDSASDSAGAQRGETIGASQQQPQLRKESRVSKHLADLTTRRVIIIVLILLFIMPLFSSDYYFDPPDSIDFATYQFSQMSIANTTHQDMLSLFQTIINIHSNNQIETPIVYLGVPFIYIDNWQSSDYANLRNDEKDAQSEPLDPNAYALAHPNDTVEIANLYTLGSDNCNIVGVLNIRPTNILESGLGIGNTLFISLVLSIASLQFSRDANELALAPLERMIEKVNKIAQNPLIAKELKIQQEYEDQLETVVIENAIIKIGCLLALGFGDAGSEIIASNMAKSGDVDPMIPGTKKCAIYGFCDIRNFTDATEQLQEDVMIFVNNIGDVVHTMADRYAGAANKNIGDAFLLVWKIPPDKYEIDEEDNSVEFMDESYMQILADFALISFMKLQAKINREPKCLMYRQDERLLKRMPGYKVKMGLGLHQGWGIEGAIGSEFKIDASYLSPNVNMASRLEAGTKMFGVPLLISSSLQSLCTAEMKKYTRQIDCVTVKGSTQAMGLYTIDMETDHLPPSKDFSYYQNQGLTLSDHHQMERQKKIETLLYLQKPEEYQWSAEQHISENKDLRLMMERWNQTFQDTFAEGFNYYVNGDWQSARLKFEQVKLIMPDDGPTKNLMEIMGKDNFNAPADWQGYHVLNDF